jgi:hypothetical protein
VSEQASKLEDHSVWFSRNFITHGCVKFELCRIKRFSDGFAMEIWYDKNLQWAVVRMGG